MSLPRLEVEAGLRRGRLEALLKVLDVDGAVAREVGGWRSTGAPWRYDAERIAGVAAARRAEQDVMRAYVAGGRCLMRTLREELDDPGAADCGRCSVCTGTLPSPGAAPDPQRVAAAVAHLRAQTTVLEPRRMWPSGAARRGRIPEGLRAEPGRALALAEDPAWGRAVTAALRGEDAVPQEVLDGLVRTLARWGWPAGRPTWVTWVPSRRREPVLRDLAERLAALGRMQLVPALAASPGGRQDDAATAVAAADTALARIGLADGVAVPAGPVLLLDDTARSGWTMTVAAAVLRAAGAGPVYPLVLHKLV